MVPVQGSEV
jgi:hypothetical protein